MADIQSSATTVRNRSVTGSLKLTIFEYSTASGASTAAGTDTVFVAGMQTVLGGYANFLSTAINTTATVVRLQPASSTKATNAVWVSHSTWGFGTTADQIRVTVWGI